MSTSAVLCCIVSRSAALKPASRSPSPITLIIPNPHAIKNLLSVTEQIGIIFNSLAELQSGATSKRGHVWRHRARRAIRHVLQMNYNTPHIPHQSASSQALQAFTSAQSPAGKGGEIAHYSLTWMHFLPFLWTVRGYFRGATMLWRAARKKGKLHVHRTGHVLTLQLASHCSISSPAEASLGQLSSKMTLWLADQISLNRTFSNSLVCTSSIYMA